MIHDLDSLRGVYKNGEREFLSTADVIIAHNPVMVDYLKQNGYSDKEIRSLNIFDYLIQDTVACRKEGEKTEVVIAGNLKREKAGYVYRLNEVEGEIQFRLYGPNYDGETQGECKILWTVQAGRVTGKTGRGFGLVWDGNGLNGCTGVFGEYMKYNNPHKTSLYLASGLPVIIWEKAAMAKYIEKIILE